MLKRNVQNGQFINKIFVSHGKEKRSYFLANLILFSLYLLFLLLLLFSCSISRTMGTHWFRVAE